MGQNFFSRLFSSRNESKLNKKTDLQPLDDFFKNQLEQYAKLKAKMLKTKEELLAEEFSHRVLLNKLNFFAFCQVHQFQQPIYFPQELAAALQELTGVAVDVKEINYAVLSSQEINCRWLDGDPIHAGSRTLKAKINCLLFGHYALVLSKPFNTLLYVDTEEIKTECVNYITAYGCEDTVTPWCARLIDISATGIAIYRTEEYGFHQQQKGRVFYSNFDYPSNEEVSAKIKEFI